jgi:acetyl-CoA carboxylase biotin carboxyl carrier protein
MSLSFDPEALRALAALLNETGLGEIELEEGDRRLRLARQAPAPMMAMAPMPAGAMMPGAAMPGAAMPGAAMPQPGASTAEPAPVAEDFAAHPGAVKSPMVGVAYLAAEPGAPPFVVPGQAVEAGDTLLLIEAMKTFSQIKAPRAGTVRHILVASGQPVEYDEPLIVLD